jgi:hypothetical protein
MIDVLTALSLYRQLDALDSTLKTAAGNNNVTAQFLAAYNNQDTFNHILEQVRSRCQDAADYLASFSHIEPITIPKGADRSAYPRFLGKVQGLKSALGALLEITATPEQRREIGFRA